MTDFYSKLHNQSKELSNKWNDAFIKFQDILIDPNKNIDPKIIQLIENFNSKDLKEQKQILIDIQNICGQKLNSDEHNSIWKIMRDLLLIIRFFEFNQQYATEHLTKIVNNLTKYV